jgi:hypothetical protein
MNLHELDDDGIALGDPETPSHGRTRCGIKGVLIEIQIWPGPIRDAIQPAPLSICHPLVRMRTVFRGLHPLNDMFTEPAEETTCAACLRARHPSLQLDDVVGTEPDQQ